jgi:predicted deacylase
MAAFKPHPVEIERPDISAWAAGNCDNLAYAHEFSSGQAGADILISALVHGNEYAGAIALCDFLSLLKYGQLKLRTGRITALFANVAGFHSFDAAQPDASRFVDQDLNRVWSTEKLDGAEQSSELARAREIRPYVERATHLLDLHTMHEPCEPLLMTGPLKRNIEFAKQLGGLGQIVIDTGHQDGVRMRDFDAFGQADGQKIALLLEAGQHWKKASVHASRDVLLRFLLNCGSISMDDVTHAGIEAWLSQDRAAPAPVRVTHAVVAQSMSFEFAGPYTGNEVFEHAGSVIAHDNGQAITTPYDSCVLVMPSVRQLRVGVTTVRLGHRV